MIIVSRLVLRVFLMQSTNDDDDEDDKNEAREY